MKNIAYTLLTFIPCIFSIAANAQKGAIEAGLEIGYGFPSGTGTLQTSSSTLSVLNESVFSYSLGAGINIGANGAYFFSDHIGAGLNIHYLMGTPEDFEYQSPGPVGGPITLHNNYCSYTGSLIAAMPYLIFKMKLGKISPYGKFGIDIGNATVVGKTTQEGVDVNSG